MDSASLATVTDALGNVAGLFAERQRQGTPSHGGAQPPFAFFDEGIEREAKRLRSEGQAKLAAALVALAEEASK